MKYAFVLRKRGGYQDFMFIFDNYEDGCIFMQNAMMNVEDEVEFTVFMYKEDKNETV